MARGSEAKASVTEKILSAFDGAFCFDKEIRIPVMENGELLQIKCVLTCAKTNVDAGGDTAIPGAPLKATKVTLNEGEEPVFEKKLVEPSSDEIEAVSNLMASLGL